MESNNNWALRRLGLFALALGGGWLTIFAYAFHSILPFNPIRLPFETSVEIKLWMPEGWAFFTRDPREEIIFLFARLKDGKWVSASVGPNGNRSHAYGLNRASRAQGLEIALLIQPFPRSAFQDCRGLPTDCLEATQSSGSLKNTSPNPSLCGEVGFVMQKPVPWAWWSSGQTVVMPSRILRINIECT